MPDAKVELSLFINGQTQNIAAFQISKIYVVTQDLESNAPSWKTFKLYTLVMVRLLTCNSLKYYLKEF